MRILWLKTELLHPIDKGGKIRTYAMMRELRALHHITYLTLDDGSAATDAAEKALEYCHEVIRVPFTQPAKGSPGFYLDLARNLASTQPYAVAKYRSPAMEEAIRNAVRTGDYDVVVCDFLFPSLNVPDDLGVPTLLFQHNVEATIWERHTAVATSWLKRWYLGLQWRRMTAWERRECQRFSHVVAVSDADRDAMRAAYGTSHVSSVPTGVDTDYFRPAQREPQRPKEIVFTGSMDWMPNEDGIGWFCDEVLPLIRARVPDATLAIVGRNPTGRVRELASRHAGVTVTGTVPDVRPWLERAGVLVVPLRVGGGTRLKIYEGMAMERATVSTTIGAEGLPVAHGEEILIADEATGFADAVVRTLTDADFAHQLGMRAARRVRRDFSWASVAAQFTVACEAAVQRATGPASAVA
ncbi:MAG: glycosyltransferase [Gemmatimonadaceae bacterium]|nr:glycosyltransferase [Gemmatimonadaceae bacterium]